MTEDNKFNIDKIKEQSQIMQTRNPDMYNRTISVYELCKAKGNIKYFFTCIFYSLYHIFAETKEADECVAAKKFSECLFPKIRLVRIIRLYCVFNKKKYKRIHRSTLVLIYYLI